METFPLAGGGYRFALLITREGRREGEGGARDRARQFSRRFSTDPDASRSGPRFSSRLDERDRSSLGVTRSGEEQSESKRAREEEAVEEEAYVTLAKTHTVTRFSYDIMLCKT